MMGFSDEVCLLQPGMTLGDVQVLAFIGKGTVGEVYEAQHEPSGETCVLKIIPRSMDEEEGDNLFLREQSRQKRLQQIEGIAAPIEMGHEDMLFWFRYPYYEPQISPDGHKVLTMADLLRAQKPKLSPAAGTWYLYAILDTLAQAHAKEVAHENLKAENIFFAPDGIKIIDFALPRWVGRGWDDFHTSREGDNIQEHVNLDEISVFSKAVPSMLSTFDIWSPEQRDGEKPTMQSDIYAVGILALRLLTGRHRMDGARPSELDDDLGPEWDEWLLRSLAYDPAERYQTAVEMFDDLPGRAEMEAEAAQAEEEARRAAEEEAARKAEEEAEYGASVEIDTSSLEGMTDDDLIAREAADAQRDYSNPNEVSLNLPAGFNLDSLEMGYTEPEETPTPQAAPEPTYEEPEYEEPTYQEPEAEPEPEPEPEPQPRPQPKKSALPFSFKFGKPKAPAAKKAAAKKAESAQEKKPEPEKRETLDAPAVKRLRVVTDSSTIRIKR
ncbi:MAG: serine/threonine protein kinase [Verrucomicrobiota bacterium]